VKPLVHRTLVRRNRGLSRDRLARWGVAGLGCVYREEDLLLRLLYSSTTTETVVKKCAWSFPAQPEPATDAALRPPQNA
jgi:hypothetical protein